MFFKKIPMTINGAEILKKQLLNLKKVQRPKVILDITRARGHGDLKENVEYHSAREEQSFIEGKIQEIENKLSKAQIIDIKKIPRNNVVVFGTTIELLNILNKETSTYQIVGEDEANINKRKISIISPLARSLIGKEEGDKVVVETPKGNDVYEIVSIKYL